MDLQLQAAAHGIQRVMNLQLEFAALCGIWRWGLLGLAVLTVFLLCYALDFHFFADLLGGFRGDEVLLSYDPCSKIAPNLLSRCTLLKSRYLPTPWLCSPHLQIAFLHYLGLAPIVSYSRQLFSTPDGGTIALDWVNSIERGNRIATEQFPASEETPIAVVIPGLTSDSSEAYIKHLVFKLYGHGWKPVVANHRGLGGVSITSDKFYNAGWTEDLRRIIEHVHEQNPKALVFAVGTSIGANVLVKYLGEEGKNTPLSGAVTIGCPWDLVICDRFIHRSLIQRIYNAVLARGLRGYARRHQSTLSRLTDWQSIDKSRTVRDFDNHCTRLVGNFETVDTYYRRCSSVHFLDGVSVPLLCISSLDDPVCTREAIPWDECSSNPNVILGVTKHGAHLAFFEGLTASSMWWARSATEFLTVLCSSIDVQKEVKESGVNLHINSEIDKGPYLNISESGKVSAEVSFSDSPLKVPTMPTPASGQPGPTTQNVDLCMMKVDLSSNCHSEIEDSGMKKHGAPSPGTENKSGPAVLSLEVRSETEIVALCSALSQLLEQIQISNSARRPNCAECSKSGAFHATNVNSQRELVPSSVSIPPTEPQALENSTPGHSADNLSKQNISLSKEVDKEKPDSHLQLRPRSALKKSDPVKTEIHISDYTSYILGSLKRLISQGRWTFWLLAYVAIVTSYPFLGPVILVRFRERFVKRLTKQPSR